MTVMRDAALTLRDAGLSLIPIVLGLKKPPIKWGEYQHRRASQAEIDRWFGDGPGDDGYQAVAVICGPISGDAEALDFDEEAEAQFAAVRELVEQFAPGLWPRLYLGRTKSGGYRVIYRCAAGVGRNDKLAQRPPADPATSDSPEILIETRAAGGLVVVDPTPGYTTIQGSLTDLPVISADERLILLACCRSRNRWVDPRDVVDTPRPTPASGRGDYVPGGRPGDDYNARATNETVGALLEAHGWTRGRGAGSTSYWTRPGKDRHEGHSATLGFIGPGVLYVFSSNAHPFQPEKAYSPFAVYAHLEHGGDWSAAARQLASEGYGTPLPERPRPTQFHDESGGRPGNGDGDAGDSPLWWLPPGVATDPTLLAALEREPLIRKVIEIASAQIAEATTRADQAEAKHDGLLKLIGNNTLQGRRNTCIGLSHEIASAVSRGQVDPEKGVRVVLKHAATVAGVSASTAGRHTRELADQFGVFGRLDEEEEDDDGNTITAVWLKIDHLSPLPGTYYDYFAGLERPKQAKVHGGYRPVCRDCGPATAVIVKKRVSTVYTCAGCHRVLDRVETKGVPEILPPLDTHFHDETGVGDATEESPSGVSDAPPAQSACREGADDPYTQDESGPPNQPEPIPFPAPSTPEPAPPPAATRTASTATLLESLRHSGCASCGAVPANNVTRDGTNLCRACFTERLFGLAPSG